MYITNVPNYLKSVKNDAIIAKYKKVQTTTEMHISRPKCKQTVNMICKIQLMMKMTLIQTITVKIAIHSSTKSYLEIIIGIK